MDAFQIKAGFAFGAVISLVFGVIGVAGFAPIALERMPSAKWPAVGGRVQGVVFKTWYDEKSRQQKYYGRVSYAYAVHGQQYTSDLTDFDAGIKRDTINAALADFAEYRKGQPVAVYYNPADPATAVLVPGMPNRLRIVLFVSIGFLVVGAGGSVVGVPWLWRAWKESLAADEAFAARYPATDPVSPAPVDFDANRVETISGIGEVRAVYGPTRDNAIAGLIISVLMIAGGIMAAVQMARQPDRPGAGIGDRIAGYAAVGALGIALPIGGIALLVWVVRLLKRRVIIGEKGMAYATGNSAEICPWDRVTAIEDWYTTYTLKVIKVPGTGIKRTGRSLEVHRNDGRSFLITHNTIADIEGLAEYLREISRRHKIKWATMKMD